MTIVNYILFVLNHTWLCVGGKWTMNISKVMLQSCFQKYVLCDASITSPKYLLTPCLLFSIWQTSSQSKLFFIFIYEGFCLPAAIFNCCCPRFSLALLQNFGMEKRRGPPYPTSNYDTSHQPWKMQRTGHYSYAQDQVIWNLFAEANLVFLKLFSLWYLTLPYQNINQIPGSYGSVPTTRAVRAACTTPVLPPNLFGFNSFS